MKTMSYFDFTQHYYKNYPNSTYSIGQHFLNVFFEDSSPYWEIWNEKDNRVAEDMIYKLILKLDLDMMNLEILNEELL